MMTEGQQTSQDAFVKDVRQIFFNLLKPYLKPLPDYFNETKDLKEQQKVFKYLVRKQDYLEEFSFNPLEYKFAEALVESSQFQCFCDGFFNDEEINNFNIFYYIIGKPVTKQTRF
jgi:hypothetical protein